MSLFISYQQLGIPVPDPTSASDDVYLDVYTVAGIKVYWTTITVSFNDGKPDLVFEGGSPMTAAYLASRFAAATNKNKVTWDGYTI